MQNLSTFVNNYVNCLFLGLCAVSLCYLNEKVMSTNSTRIVILSLSFICKITENHKKKNTKHKGKQNI